MADGYVRVPPDSSGKYIDANELQTYPAGTLTTVERQRIVIPDEVSVGGEWLTRMLVEQRIQNLLLAQGLGVNENIDGLRDELSDIAGLIIPTVRETLTDDRIYYVAKTGSDSNDGLSSSSPLLTVQAAVTAAEAIDAANYGVAISIAAGTYDEQITISRAIEGIGTGIFSGYAATFDIQGDLSGGTILTNSGTANATVLCAGSCNLRYLTIKSTVASGINAFNAGGINIDPGMIFGACVTAQITAANRGTVALDIPYSITGAGSSHLYVAIGGYIEQFSGAAVTMSGALNFSTAFLLADLEGIYYGNDGFTGGTITGKRYAITNGATVNTLASGPNYFPGDSAGTGGTTVGGGYYS